MRSPSIVAVALLASSMCAAPALAATITLDTSALIGGVTGPYYLDFQLVDGDGVADNTVMLSNFNFGAGGAAVGAPMLTGGASGDVASGITLSDTVFFNELIQLFTPGDMLSFSIAFTTSFVAPTPDRFTFAILDGSLFEVPTLGAGNELVGIDLRLPSIIETYAGIASGPSPVLPSPQVDVIPEPATVMLLGSGLAALLGRRWRRPPSR